MAAVGLRCDFAQAQHRSFPAARVLLARPCASLHAWGWGERRALPPSGPPECLPRGPVLTLSPPPGLGPHGGAPCCTWGHVLAHGDTLIAPPGAPPFPPRLGLCAGFGAPPSYGGARAFLPCFLLLILHLQPLLGIGAEWELVVPPPSPPQKLQSLWGALGAAPPIRTAPGVKLFHVSLCVLVSNPRVGSVLGLGGWGVSVSPPLPAHAHPPSAGGQ